MALEKITRVRGRGVAVPGDDLDTDRIVPARFLRCVTFDGLGKNLFHDVRYREDGTPLAHPLNDPRFSGATIMIVNQNFGCGSSREHAPQAIAKSGFRAIIGESFAEIFFGNSTTLGIPCVTVSHDAVLALGALVEKTLDVELTVDLGSSTVSAGELTVPLTIKPQAREALMGGEWDPIARLLEGQADVRALAGRLPYLSL